MSCFTVAVALPECDTDVRSKTMDQNDAIASFITIVITLVPCEDSVRTLQPGYWQYAVATQYEPVHLS